MNYNVGDKVRIKSFDWYNENKDEDGIVEFKKFIGKYIVNRNYDTLKRP